MRRIIAVVMTMVILSISVCAYSDDEIERRIDEVGNEYIEFYRQGNRDAWSGESCAVCEVADEEMAYYDASANEAAAFPGSTPQYTPAPAARKASEEEIFYEDPFNTEAYAPVEESGFHSVKTQQFSTFGADVDTASYSSLRRKLLEPYAYKNPYFRGIDDSAIRIEEMINYFTYHYNEPEEGEKFGVTTTLCECPWNDENLLLKVGIRAEEQPDLSKGSNIVFLVDTSGSMFEFDKLSLVKTALGILTEQLTENDIVSVVTYAGDESVALEGAPGNEKDWIMDAVNSLIAWGSTWGEGGINKAYEIAEKYYIEGGNNRVILCTDGDFNVGVSSEAGLKKLISEKRESGVYFSCLGFGGGNYDDTTMETLADNGNGNYFYIDCEREARRALSEEFFSTIFTVAEDTKFQIEFNPRNVKAWRQIGYENRAMAAEDFADDKKDGGEVGAGQTVTVLYEIVPSTSGSDLPEVTSRYTDSSADSSAEAPESDELLAVNIRWKEPGEKESVLRTWPVMADDIVEMDVDTSWAAGVAQAGMLMRNSEYAGTTTPEAVYDRLKEDPEIMENDYKAEFLFMLRAMKDYMENRAAENE